MFFSKKDKDRLHRIEAILVRVHACVHVVKSQQKQTLKELEIIMPSVAELEAAIQDVKGSVTSGIQAIDAAVVAAADRVIASINAGADVSAQIAELEELKSSVSSQAAAEVEKVNAIDPAPAPPVEPPVEA